MTSLNRAFHREHSNISLLSFWLLWLELLSHVPVYMFLLLLI